MTNIVAALAFLSLPLMLAILLIVNTLTKKPAKRVPSSMKSDGAPHSSDECDWCWMYRSSEGRSPMYSGGDEGSPWETPDKEKR